jgi:glycerophosphoryl diester phosphodiesterase
MLEIDLRYTRDGEIILNHHYRAILRLGVDIIETDIPRELGPLLYGGQPVPASKAGFFRAGRP